MGRHDLLGADGLGDLQRVRVVEGHSACEEFIEGDPQAPEIGLEHRAAPKMFRSHVRWGANAGGGVGHMLHLQHSARAEVRHLGYAFLGDENVRGAQIPMEDLVAVGEGDGGSYINADFQSASGMQTPISTHHAVQALALHIFQHHEEDAVLPFGGDELHDVGMLQGGHDPRFLELIHDLILLLVRNLERHLAVHPGVHGQVHGAEPPRPQTVEDLVLAQHLVFGKHGGSLSSASQGNGVAVNEG